MELNSPRIATFTANNTLYLCFEEGTDAQYSDIIVEIGSSGETGVDMFDENLVDVQYMSYMMCFEDSPIADYDMNDVVLKFERLGLTKVKVTLLACGAYDELYLRGLEGSTLNGNQEIHALFKVPVQTFINTDGDTELDPISDEFPINATQRLSDFVEKIYVYDATKGREITLAGKGTDPHAIVIPGDFQYPLEKKCINSAYPLFNNWAGNAEQDRFWFRNAIEQYIYKK